MADGPVLIDSGLSQEFEIDGYLLEIHIYRLEDDTAWTLEVLDEDDTSHVWDEAFTSEFGALIGAQKAIRTAGPNVFMAGNAAPTVH